MKSIIAIIFLFSSLSFAQDATTAPTAEAPAETPKEVVGAEVNFPTKDELASKPLYWMCRASTVARTLKVENNNGTCKTIYNKDGVDRDSGQSKEVAHCYAVFKSIKKSLESNGWTCKDIGSAPVVVNE